MANFKVLGDNFEERMEDVEMAMQDLASQCYVLKLIVRDIVDNGYESCKGTALSACCDYVSQYSDEINFDFPLAFAKDNQQDKAISFIS